MADLFDTSEPKAPDRNRPLADRLRPRTLAEVIGQQQVLGSDGPLGAMLGAAGRGQDHHREVAGG